MNHPKDHVISFLTPEELANMSLEWLTCELFACSSHIRSRVQTKNGTTRIMGVSGAIADISYLQSVSVALAAKVSK